MDVKHFETVVSRYIERREGSDLCDQITEEGGDFWVVAQSTVVLNLGANVSCRGI